MSGNLSHKKRKRSAYVDLPILAYKDKLLNAIANNQVTIVVGETGCGKSTQLPQYIADMSSQKVICSQPRRVAAVTIAHRVAAERQCEIGGEVGYSIRFEDKSSAATCIKYVTDGVLLREFMSDEALQKYDCIILDEAHERSLNTDILMGLLKQLFDKRSDMKLVIMSATLEVETFKSFFIGAAVVTVPGRQHDVDVFYVKVPEPDYVDAALQTCLQIHEDEGPLEGGVLVFLPGQDDIESLHALLEEHLPHTIPFGRTELQIPVHHRPSHYIVLPLYAAMSADDQMKAFQPAAHGVRKFVLATNIAETSVTVSGIKFVVDTGLVKSRYLHSTTGLEKLQVVPVSQSQASQRSGRAGRESAGKCYRIYTESSFVALPLSSLPEIQRVGISQVLLQLLAMGVSDPLRFPYPSPPSATALEKSLKQLYYLGAVSRELKLSPLGLKMSRLPLDPTFAYLLLCSESNKCVAEILVIVAMLSAENVLMQPHKEHAKKAASTAHRRFASKDGDMISLMNIFDAWIQARKDAGWAHRNYLNQRSLLHALSVRDQLATILSQLSIDTSLTSKPSKEPVLKCIAQGLFLNVATKAGSITTGKQNKQAKFTQNMSTQYRTIVGNQPAFIHPSSFILSTSSKSYPKFIVYADMLITTKEYMHHVSAVDETWMRDLHPNLNVIPSTS